MNSCLVTGATGFIGRVLCERLRERGLRVRAAGRLDSGGPWDDFVAIDLGSGNLPAGLLDGIDTVFHLAGRTHALSEVDADMTEYRLLNVGSMQALLKSAAPVGLSRFVFISSVKAMGEGGDECLDEKSRAEPTTPYGMTKLEAERMLLAAGQSTGMHVSVLRLPLVYGRGVKGNLWKMINAIERGRFPPLPEIGNKRSLVHVDDVVRAAMLVAEDRRSMGEIYILTDGHPYSTTEMYRMMCNELGKADRRPILPLAALRMAALVGDVIGRLRGRRFVFDSDAYEKLLGSAWYSSRKIEAALGFQPTRNLRDSMEEMVQAYRRDMSADLGVSPT